MRSLPPVWALCRRGAGDCRVHGTRIKAVLEDGKRSPDDELSARSYKRSELLLVGDGRKALNKWRAF